MAKRPQSTADYLVVDHGGRVGTTNWAGAVVIGAEAIYLFKESLPRPPGGLVFLLAEAVASRVLPTRDLPGVAYDQIPGAVRMHGGWPIREAMTCNVLIVPRKSISVIHRVGRAHSMQMDLGGMPVSIDWGQFGGKGIKDFLVAKGWPLVWSGELSNISGSAVASLPKPAQPHVTILAIVFALFMVLVSMLAMLIPAGYEILTGVLIGGAWIGALAGILFAISAFHRGV
jgi:hypothetical protein